VTARLRRLLPAVLTLSLLCGCDRVENWFKKSPSEELATIPARADGKVAMLLPDFTQLVERAGPAVVNIQATRSAADQAAEEGSQGPRSQDDPFFGLFKHILPPSGDGHDGQDPAQSDSISYGSGFIISSNGYIMTNAHVVNGGNPIKVVMTDKREMNARLVGLDMRTDVALLKVEASALPVVKIGDPDALKPGEWVAAIGAPFGFENSVTAGIVSAKGRNLPDETYVPFIQTDVAINPGNSGGPLFNLRGEVIGINSQIYSRSGGFMGISFAIPIDLAMNVADQIKTNGKVSRGQLGVSIQEVTQSLAQSFGLPRPHGALVVRVEPQSSASRAGIQQGDIILQINQHTVQSATDLPMLIGDLQPRTRVKLRIWRKKNEVNLEATLGEQTSSANPQATAPLIPQSFSFDKLGLIVTEIPAEKLSRLGLKGGLVVERSRGIAARAGLQRGDLIIGVNQSEVTSVKALENALNASRQSAALLVKRTGDILFIPLNLD